jgi:hypothetical protein
VPAPPERIIGISIWSLAKLSLVSQRNLNRIRCALG